MTADGSVKLLDFGIAKLIAPELSGETAEQTGTLFRMFTPDYASPEQIRGEPVSTASDVYALGVVLFELLTGSKPYRTTDLPPTELIQTICEREPPRRRASRIRPFAGAGGGPGHHRRDRAAQDRAALSHVGRARRRRSPTSGGTSHRRADGRRSGIAGEVRSPPPQPWPRRPRARAGARRRIVMTLRERGGARRRGAGGEAIQDRSEARELHRLRDPRFIVGLPGSTPARALLAKSRRISRQPSQEKAPSRLRASSPPRIKRSATFSAGPAARTW